MLTGKLERRRPFIAATTANVSLGPAGSDSRSVRMGYVPAGREPCVQIAFEAVHTARIMLLEECDGLDFIAAIPCQFAGKLFCQRAVLGFQQEMHQGPGVRVMSESPLPAPILLGGAKQPWQR